LFGQVIDDSIHLPQSLKRLREQRPSNVRQNILHIFKLIGKCAYQTTQPNRKDHAILARDRTNLITHGGSLLNESLANRSKGLDVLLIQSLNRNPVNTRRTAASQMASASFASFFWCLAKGFTCCAGIAATQNPLSSEYRPQKLDDEHASIAMRADLGSSSSTPESFGRETFLFQAMVPSTDNAQILSVNYFVRPATTIVTGAMGF
jgi:hypothetical protein